MSSLSPSLFIKEPGRTKNLVIESPSLRKEVKSLRPGDLLDVRAEGGKVTLSSKLTKEVIGEILEEKINKKITFALSNKCEILVIFVSLVKGVKAPKMAAQFLIKSSVPVFPEESPGASLKPFVRSGEIPQDEKDDLSSSSDTTDANDETTSHEETDPLAGLTVVGKDDLVQEAEDI